MERGENRPYADPVTHQFLVEAIGEDAHLKKPKDMSEHSWVKAGNMAGVYFGTRVTLDDLGGMYGYRGHNKREGPRISIKCFMVNLRQNCSSSLQEKYPLAEIRLGKRLSVWALDRKSAAQGSKRAEIRELVLAETNGYGQIAQTLGISIRSVRRQVASLRMTGELLPLPLPVMRSRPIFEQLKVATDPQEIAKLFEAIADQSLLKRPDLCLTVSRAALDSGYNVSWRNLELFLEALSKAGIPFKKIEKPIKSGRKAGKRYRYHLLLRQQIPAVKEAFAQATELAQFKKPPIPA